MERTSKAPSPTFLEALPSCPYTVRLSRRVSLLVLTRLVEVLKHFLFGDLFGDRGFLNSRLFSGSPPI